jgi:hypothetical protein
MPACSEERARAVSSITVMGNKLGRRCCTPPPCPIRRRRTRLEALRHVLIQHVRGQRHDGQAARAVRLSLTLPFSGARKHGHRLHTMPAHGRLRLQQSTHHSRKRRVMSRPPMTGISRSTRAMCGAGGAPGAPHKLLPCSCCSASSPFTAVVTCTRTRRHDGVNEVGQRTRELTCSGQVSAWAQAHASAEMCTWGGRHARASKPCFSSSRRTSLRFSCAR